MAGGWSGPPRHSPSDSAWSVESGKPKEQKSVFKRLSAAFRSKPSKTPVEGFPPNASQDHSLSNRSDAAQYFEQQRVMRPSMSIHFDQGCNHTTYESPYSGRGNSLPFGSVDWSPSCDRWSSEIDASTMSIMSSTRFGLSSNSPSVLERTPSWSSHITGTPRGTSNASTPRLSQHCLVTAEAGCGMPSCGNNDIELFMMYASPLTCEMIDVAAEVEVLNEAILESNAQIQLNVGVATAGSLNKLLTLARSRRGLVLHLSAHAVTKKSPGGEDSVGLVLEDAKGCEHVLWREDLEELLGMREQGLRNISLLFLSTCYSERLAQVFIECGCRHVVAVRSKVHDTAAQRFSQQFYRSLAVNDSLLVAWEGARRALRIDPDRCFAAQADDFVLFGQHGAERVTLPLLCGQEQPMAPMSQLGDFESVAVVLKAIQTRADDFVGREASVYALMDVFSTVRGRRACAVHGPEGIGKSALGAEFARFASGPGRIFSCASIIVRFETTDLDSLVHTLEEQLHALSSQLRVPLRNMSGCSQESSFHSHRDNSRPSSSCSVRSSGSGNSFEHTIDDPLQFLQPARTRISRGFKDLERLRGRSARVLLIVDDGAGVLSSSSEARRLLGDLLADTQRLYVLILSRQPVYSSLGAAKVANIRLEGLDRKDAARLFLRRAHRPLENSDFVPSGTHAPQHGPGPGGGPDRLQRIQIDQLRMMEHPLIYRLAGHPGRIRAMSSRVTPGGPSLLELLANFSEQDLDASPTQRFRGKDDEDMPLDGMTGNSSYALLPGAQQSPSVDRSKNSEPPLGASQFGF